MVLETCHISIGLNNQSFVLEEKGVYSLNDSIVGHMDGQR